MVRRGQVGISRGGVLRDGRNGHQDRLAGDGCGVRVRAARVALQVLLLLLLLLLVCMLILLMIVLRRGRCRSLWLGFAAAAAAAAAAHHCGGRQGIGSRWLGRTRWHYLSGKNVAAGVAAAVAAAGRTALLRAAIGVVVAIVNENGIGRDESIVVAEVGIAVAVVVVVVAAAAAAAAAVCVVGMAAGVGVAHGLGDDSDGLNSGWADCELLCLALLSFEVVRRPVVAASAPWHHRKLLRSCDDGVSLGGVQSCQSRKNQRIRRAQALHHIRCKLQIFDLQMVLRCLFSDSSRKKDAIEHGDKFCLWIDTVDTGTRTWERSVAMMIGFSKLRTKDS